MQLSPSRLFNFVQKREYAVKTPYKVFQDIDLTKQKTVQIAVSSIPSPVPLSTDWQPPSRIEIISQPKTLYRNNLKSWEFGKEDPQDFHSERATIVLGQGASENGNPEANPTKPKTNSSGCFGITSSERESNYYFGGLPALMQAVYKLEEDPSAIVVFVNDGQVPKTLQSGHQGHVHPSEWSATECQIKQLCKTLAKSIGILNEDDPNDLENYSYLHFPRVFSKKDIGIFGAFFAKRLIHNLTSKNGLSKQDHWLCDNIRDSLAFHQKISDLIEQETGQISFKKGFRVYWSTNIHQLEKKKQSWEDLKIPCEYMTKQEIVEHTLLKTDMQFPVLKIIGDGKFYPNSFDLILSYLQRTYPDRFTYRKSAVREILINDNTGKPFMVFETDRTTPTKVSSLFGSVGHSEVFQSNKRLWNEVPVSGISSVWKCQIDKTELQSRFGNADLSDEELKIQVEHFVAAANLSNLHVTTWDCSVNKTHVEIIVRATQGANFNSHVAAKNDLLNMRNNLDQYFIGDWELISVGTCTRKTWVSNVPEFYKLSEDSGLIHGLSGIGFSFSGASFNNLKHP